MKTLVTSFTILLVFLNFIGITSGSLATTGTQNVGFGRKIIKNLGFLIKNHPKDRETKLLEKYLRIQTQLYALESDKVLARNIFSPAWADEKSKVLLEKQNKILKELHRLRTKYPNDVHNVPQTLINNNDNNNINANDKVTLRELLTRDRQ